MLSPGNTLGRYQIRSLIGAGGMGEVYLAHDTQLERPVALKVLPPEVRGDAERRQRLEQEARAASALNHPNILTIYDIGVSGDDHFIASEFIDGLTLRQRISGEEMSLDEVLRIAAQIASAVAAAEAAGLVHRDIKPDNIMVRGDGYVKVLDFGLARVLEASERSLTQTDPYTIRGTVHYMSPEQVRGHRIDSRSDIWSTGVVLYELVTRRLPFDGPTASDIVASILKTTPPVMDSLLPTPLPPKLEEIVRKALAKEREERYASAREMLEDLEHLRRSLDRVHLSARGRDEARQITTERLALADLPLHNLPSQLATFVGRASEKQEVIALLRRPDVRLVTLTGPGGTGKSRLGIEIGWELLRDFEDGVQFVSLASVTDARLVLPAIAEALEVPPESLRDALREKHSLLVLDNFEQIVDAGPAVAELLASAPMVKAIVTSRATLHVRGEHEYAVPPLTTPDLAAANDLDALSRYSAVALFLHRAAAVKRDFMLTRENAAAIAEICIRLEGLPLAIELAASRVKLLTPSAMLARLGSRLGLLSGGPRDLPERQQTMRAAISWGHQLLDDSEKRLFENLSVFVGGFSLDAAESLCAAVGDSLDVLDGLASLADKSFLRHEESDEPRFRMLETIREYGVEQLAASGRDDVLRRAHAELVAAAAERAEPLLRDQPQAWLRRLIAEHDNFRAALEWSLAHDESDVAIRIAAALWWFWYLHGHYTEGRRWLDRVLTVPGLDASPLRAKVLTGAGQFAFLQCDYDRATDLLHHAVDAARAIDDRRSLALALQYGGSIARERGEYDHAIDLHQLARTIWEDLGDRANVARSINYAAFSSWLKGDFARATELATSTYRTFRELGDSEGIAWSLLNLAASAHFSGDAHRAAELSEEALAWSRQADFREGVAWALHLLGWVRRAEGKREQAIHLLRDSLEIHWSLGDRWRTASVLEQLAGLLAPELAARLFGAAEGLRSALRTPVPPAELAQYERDVAALRSGDRESLDRAWDEGIAAPPGESVALALR